MSALSQLSMSIEEKQKVEQATKFLSIFYETTTNLSGSNYPTIGIAILFMDNIVESLVTTNYSTSEIDIPQWIAEAASKMDAKLNQYSEKIFNKMSYIAAILDPRIKINLMPSIIKTPPNLDLFKNYFTHHYSESQSTQNLDAQKNQYITLSLAQKIAQKRRPVERPSGLIFELNQYLIEPILPMELDILEWWKSSQRRFPNLSRMARDILAVQATSVPSEELFSSAGDMISKKRTRLSHQTVQVKLCLESWFKNGFSLKFKRRGSL